MLNFIKKHIDFRIYKVTWLSVLTALLIIPCVLFLPEHFGYENGLLENIQMFVLFIGLYLSFFSKTDRKFFIFVGLVLTILTLREVNCGRTLFFPIEGYENAYYRWEDIKYGYLVHPIFGAFIAFVGLYFIKNKLFLNLWTYLSKTAIPFWNVIFMILGMVLGIYAEHSSHNMVFEEITEFLFYVSLVGIICLYTRCDKFRVD